MLAHPSPMTPMSAELKASRRDTTLILTLSNPGMRNALHPDMYTAAVEALATAERDESVRAVVLTGADRYFCAGGNLHRLLENRSKEPAEQDRTIDQLHGWVDAIRDCPKPVIAAVEGGAAGAAFGLALACDLIVAGSSARFAMSYVTVGLSPDGGSSWLLAHSLPRQLANEILLGGKPITATRLHELGVVNRLAADGDALEVALAWADEFAQHSPNALERIKALIQEAHTNDLAQHMQLEKRHFVESLHHRDAQEGISAFLEKRKAHYK
jgi:enoyl-CoA hydratase/carnithine racemase